MKKTSKNFGTLAPLSTRDSQWNSGFLAELFEKSSHTTRETLKMALWHKDNSATFENFKTAEKLKVERAKHGFEERYEFAGGTSDWVPGKAKQRPYTKARAGVMVIAINTWRAYAESIQISVLARSVMK